MSNGNTSGVAIGGLLLGTLFAVLAVAAGGWFGMSYHYGQERLAVREKVLATAEWTPVRVQREGMAADCDAGRMREEAEARLAEVGVFDLGKVDRFPAAPNDQRARELSRTLKQMDPGVQAFLQAAECSKNSRFPRSGREQSLSGPLLARAVQVDAWLNAERVPDLQKVLWVGRDIQATGGLYEFREGAVVMDAAYVGLQKSIASGDADAALDALLPQLAALVAAEESAQLHWRAGARILLADLLGPEWDANPPTPLRARAMIESMDEVISSLEGMPDVANQPFPVRRKAMTEWAEKHDMSTWDQRFRGFGKAGVEIDAFATTVAARGRAVWLQAALRSFRKKRGGCPRELAELVDAGLISAVPTDPIADAPFTYERDACRVVSTAPDAGVSVSAVAFP